MFEQPQWLAVVETLTFIVLIATILYNRAINWKKYNERQTKLELAFEQYQKDIEMYLKTCEVCRAEVRNHHERTDIHVTMDMRDQIRQMAQSINEIKAFLMKE